MNQGCSNITEKALNLYIKFVGVLKTQTREYQILIVKIILNSVCNKLGQTICVLVSRQGGKNHTLIDICIFCCTQIPGIKIGFYAPSFDQAKITSRRLRNRLKKFGVNVDKITQINNEKVVEFTKPSIIYGPYAYRDEGSLLGIYSHSETTSKEGQTWDLIIIDEAQDLNKEVFEVEIEPMGASTNATNVFIGTPWSEDCIFYDKIQHAKKTGTYLEFPWQVVASCISEYGQFIQKKAVELGENSIAFLTQYCLQWVKGLSRFFDPDLFSDLKSEKSWIEAPESGKKYVFGLDVAGDDQNNTGSTDFTVIHILEVDDSKVKSKEDRPETTVIYSKAWRGVDWENQYNMAVSIIKQWRCYAGVIDATGMGSSFSDRIEKACKGFCKIERFVFTENSKSDLGHYANAETSAKRAKYCNTDNSQMREFKFQAEHLKREAKKNKKINYYVPEHVGHDDYMLSWFLGIKAASMAYNAYNKYIREMR